MPWKDGYTISDEITLFDDAVRWPDGKQQPVRSPSAREQGAQKRENKQQEEEEAAQQQPRERGRGRRVALEGGVGCGWELHTLNADRSNLVPGWTTVQSLRRQALAR